MSKQTNIPQLRFPEFKGEWEKKKLVEVADKIQDGTHFSPQVFDKGDYLYLTSKNVKNGYLELSNAQYISKESHESIYKRCDVRNGDVLITKDGTIGQTCVNELDEQFSLLSSVAFIRPKDEFSNYFIYQLLVSPKGQKEIDSQIAGQALKRVTLTKINIFEYFFPKLPEQTKIASFLTAVDEKIQALKKKHSLLEQYKKGVMQRLFLSEAGLSGFEDEQDKSGLNDLKINQDINNPKILKSSKSRFRQLRFKDENGKDFPEWEVKKLGEVLEYEQPTNYLVSSTEYNDKFKTPVVTAGKTFILGYTDETKCIFKNNLPVIIFDDFTTATQFVDFPFKAKSSAMKILKAKGNTNIKFIYEAMQMIDYEIGGHGRHWISVFAEMEILMPSIAEQTAIANFLSALDEKINQTQTQIEKTEVWKKGLLQKMFV